MHRTNRARHSTAECAPNTLMSEADAENWHATGKVVDDGRRYSSLNGSAGARRDDQCARPEVSKVIDADPVIPDYLRRLAKLPEVPGKDEGVVVVDADNQNGSRVSKRNASKMRCAFARTSSYW